MKSQRTSWEATDGSSLRISLVKNKKGEFKTMVRHRDAQEGRVRMGCKNWFEATEDDKAQASYDELVRQAESGGWSRVVTNRKRKELFTEIPMAPQLNLEAVEEEVADLVGELKAKLKTQTAKSAKR